MSKITFNGSSKIITVNPGEYTVNAIDIYTDWKAWALEAENLKFPLAMKSIGGEPIDLYESLGVTIFLINGWKILPADEDHTLTIQGNIYSDDNSNYVLSRMGRTITVKLKVSSLTQSQNIESISAIAQQLPEYINSNLDGSINIDNSTIVAAIQSALKEDMCSIDFLRKLQTNRVQTAGDMVTIYDDDSTTILRQFRIGDDFKIPIGDPSTLGGCSGDSILVDLKTVVNVLETTQDLVVELTSSTAQYNISGSYVSLGATRDVFLNDGNILVVRNGVQLNKETEVVWLSADSFKIPETVLADEVIEVVKLQVGV